ncbi:hypothetical protein [Rufibacter latericius]|uniref:Outer membrane protein beta-barrel domain-containing protein n=1 Tax=Rufibacter latericius TaxID=2487040 RepID=A0A3M9M8X6_9BACT|nr:hypothetical protein [Rufibacter latericius]RNI22011.1 hypothetical protein EFB08_23040 [Rufibacter latericius]
MKKPLLSFLGVLATVFSAMAQTITPPQSTAPVASTAVRDGNWMIGAGIGSIGHNFKSETFTLEIEPRAGYFISDNAAIGAQVQLGLEAYDGGELFNYGITPFVRYYFPEGAAPTHRWFGEALVGFAGSNQEDSEGDRFFSTVYGVRAGYAHFVATNVSLEGTLNLVRSHANIDVGSGTSGSTGLSLGLAFQIYLPSRGTQ